MILVYIALVVTLVYMFLNLGNFLDVTQKPKDVDIIVSLGGGPGLRLGVATELYNKGYSKSNKLIYTGSDRVRKSFEPTMSKKKYLIKNGILAEDIIHAGGKFISNTMEEIMFVKKNMLENNYKSVIFVSHQFHSRRVAVLADFVAGYKASGLSLSVVSCDPWWWNSNTYYTRLSNIELSIKELIKIVYNITKYSLFPTEKYKKLKC